MRDAMKQSEPQELRQERLKACMRKVAEERDRQAFEVLFDHYVPLIRAYSLAREPGSKLVADELAQDVIIKVWEKAHTYKPQLAGLNTWVYTLARNCRVDYWRRNGRHVSDIDPTDIFAGLEDDEPGPFQRAQQQRVDESLKNSIEQLPEEQAEVLNKVYLEGKSHQEASDELALPLGTVKSRIRLAIHKLELMLRR